MSSRTLRALVAAGALLALAACGFQPLYGDSDRSSTRSEENLAQISVGIIADRTGQMLRNELGSRLDPNNIAPPAQYDLSVKLNESIGRVAVRRDASATRANLTVTATYQLVSRATGEPVYSGTVRSVNSYDILGTENQFGTETAREEARRRAARDLSEQIAIRLALALEQTAATGR